MIGLWELLIILAVLIAVSIPFIIAMVALIRSWFDKDKKTKS